VTPEQLRTLAERAHLIGPGAPHVEESARQEFDAAALRYQTLLATVALRERSGGAEVDADEHDLLRALAQELAVRRSLLLASAATATNDASEEAVAAEPTPWMALGRLG